MPARPAPRKMQVSPIPEPFGPGLSPFPASDFSRKDRRWRLRYVARMENPPAQKTDLQPRLNITVPRDADVDLDDRRPWMPADDTFDRRNGRHPGTAGEPGIAAAGDPAQPMLESIDGEKPVAPQSSL